MIDWLKARWHGLRARWHGGATPRDESAGNGRDRFLPSLWTALILLIVMVNLVLAWSWSREPKPFWVVSGAERSDPVVGSSTTDTLVRVAGTLLDKPGGYLTNDVMPPSVLLDNIPNWEFGVLVQVRDLARVLRNDYSRSQSQSVEDADLAEAEPLFNFDNSRWLFPSTERKYRQAIGHVQSYQQRLLDDEAKFYARADNLREWLSVVEKRLGSLSQRLSASVGQRRVNIDLAGEPAAAQSGEPTDDVIVETPWYELDDVFFEARGTAWALIHFLRAAEFDFRDVLRDKNAQVSLRQIIRELEASQHPLRSPIILNGSGFGLFANHSLVMASYLSRAHSAVIDLRALLGEG